MFDTVLVANRGEIAVRILRTLHALGIRSVAVYSDADRDAPHVRAADAAVRLGPAPPAQSYLAVDRILDAARRAGADAVHPGYGFLSENAAFARACADAGVVFVGPPPAAIEAMGDKIRARATVEAAGVPVVPGVHASGLDDAALAAAAADVGYPLLVKAAAGGGGKGMRVVTAADQLAEALAAARREASAAFGDDSLLIERYLPAPRHIEVQVFADAHGGVVHLGERECSLQRRYQKVVEECPSPAVDEDTRRRMTAAAVAAAEACGYVGAGTVEFLTVERPDAPAAGADFFFLEMNTRLQVEHAVTEEVYGVDLVEWQLRVAAGERLPLPQEDLRASGHAVEARIYAEDPARGFLPTGGRVRLWSCPQAVGIRVDAGVRTGVDVSTAYDPLLAKVIASGPDRRTALRRLRHHLQRCALLGVVSNTGFLVRLLAQPDVVAGRCDTGLVERHVDQLAGAVPCDLVVAAAGLARLVDLHAEHRAASAFDVRDGWRVGEHAAARWRVRAGARVAAVAVRGTPAAAQVSVDGGPFLPASARRDGSVLDVEFGGKAASFTTATGGDVAWFAAPGVGTWGLVEEEELLAARSASQAADTGPLRAPLPGTVTGVRVREGDEVAAGQTLVTVEAMKMEHPITAPAAGTVRAVVVGVGDTVAIDQPLVVVDVAGGTR